MLRRFFSDDKCRTRRWSSWCWRAVIWSTLYWPTWPADCTTNHLILSHALLLIDLDIPLSPLSSFLTLCPQNLEKYKLYLAVKNTKFWLCSHNYFHGCRDNQIKTFILTSYTTLQRRSWPEGPGVRTPPPPPSWPVRSMRNVKIRWEFFCRGVQGEGWGSWWRTCRDPPEPSNLPMPLLHSPFKDQGVHIMWSGIFQH